MLQNAYFLAKIGADTAENEQHFAEILPKIAPRGAGDTAKLPLLPSTPAAGTGARARGCGPPLFRTDPFRATATASRLLVNAVFRIRISRHV